MMIPPSFPLQSVSVPTEKVASNFTKRSLGKVVRSSGKLCRLNDTSANCSPFVFFTTTVPLSKLADCVMFRVSVLSLSIRIKSVA